MMANIVIIGFGENEKKDFDDCRQKMKRFFAGQKEIWITVMHDSCSCQAAGQKGDEPYLLIEYEDAEIKSGKILSIVEKLEKNTINMIVRFRRLSLVQMKPNAEEFKKAVAENSSM
jgi:hypothetical protein